MTANPYEWELTEDVQHDLAMALADGENDADLAAELLRRGAAQPVDCAWVHDPYARHGRRLVYQLAEVTP